jgi:hypothetical protein
MLVYKSGLLLPVGSHLRWVDLERNTIEYDRQIGCCQILQVQENGKYILVVQFDGLISMLEKEGLEIRHQFYAPGKEFRHTAFNDHYLACACQIVEGSSRGRLVGYKM